MGQLLRSPPKPTTTVSVTSIGPDEWRVVRELYAEHFGAWSEQRFAERLRWQFDANPLAADHEREILVGNIGDRTVGMFAMFPLPLRTPRGPLTIACTSDLVAEPDSPMTAVALLRAMRRHPDQLASGMSREAEALGKLTRETSVPLSEAMFSFRLGNVGRMRRAMRRRLPRWLHWTSRTPAATLLARCVPPEGRTPMPAPGPLEDRVTELSDFDERYEELWNTFAEGFDYCVDRTPQYMRWRYIECPAQSVRMFGLTATDGSLDGILVIGERHVLADDRVPCGSCGEILELIVRDREDRDAVRTLIGVALRELSRAQVDSVTATGLCADYHAALEDLGFSRTRPKFKLAVRLDPEKHPHREIARDDSWYLSAGDGEQLYALLA